jgi:hypothetical protein
VEQLVDYLEAMECQLFKLVLPKENVSFLTLEKNETGRDISSAAKHFILFSERKHFKECCRLKKVFHQKINNGG